MWKRLYAVGALVVAIAVSSSFVYLTNGEPSRQRPARDSDRKVEPGQVAEAPAQTIPAAVKGSSRPVIPDRPWTASRDFDAQANFDFAIETSRPENVRLRGQRRAQNWPQFAGPNRDNKSRETGLLRQWPEGGPKLAWISRGIGTGFSSVAVVDGVVYTMGNKDRTEAVIALDAGTGEKIWSTPIGWASLLREGDGPRSTPTMHQGKVYALGGKGNLACLKASDGTVYWQRNILRDFGAKTPDFGIAESVLIDQNRLICTPGGDKATLVALDPKTGKELWTALLPQKDRANYSSPLIAEVGGLRQYVQFTAAGTVGVRAENGEFLWRDNTAANGLANCSCPLVVGNLVLTSSSYGTGASLVRLIPNQSKTKAELVYHTLDMKSHHGGMLVTDGSVYGSSDPGILTCLDLATGKVKWRTHSVGKGSITYAEGRLYLRSEKGAMYLVDAAPAGYRDLGHFEQPKRSDSPAWPYPVVAAGKLFLRDQDLLLCYDLQAPTAPEQAAASLSVPPGFRVSLFASEPVVPQPIALATDARGRVWAAINNTYDGHMRPSDLSHHDRIVVLEDTDGDGHPERSTVFCDGLQRLTSVEVGFGGVWALCPPRLLFIPDRNGDDKPDGPPETVLDGWADGLIQHAIANGLRWGPDGWLYGRQGVFDSSLVGPPNALPSQRTALKGGIWRYHPTRKIFEVVCRGTTNPWGMDWDENGELFFINTMIGHLWHAVPGAHFQRMVGQDDPHLYQLMGQTADHYHWDTGPAIERRERNRMAAHSDAAEPTARDSEPLLYSRFDGTRSADRFGGGHAHAGLMIYQGDQWPDRYRGNLFMVNLLGQRVNTDILERRGCGYVGRHGLDFCRSADPWFQGIEILAAPDGGAYLADWCDRGECHGSDGVDRSNGRIYKITYGPAKSQAVGDLARLPNADLVALQLHKNDWFARQSRRLLQERALVGHVDDETRTALKLIFTSDPSPAHRLRALWCLHVIGAASEPWLLAQRTHSDEHVRAWIVRLLSDGQAPSAEARRALASMASHETSGLVLLYLASALPRVKSEDRWPLATALAGHPEFANDPAFPLMVWYGIESAVVDSPLMAVKLAERSQIPLIAQFIARRLSENIRQSPEPIDQLVRLVINSRSFPQIVGVLSGMEEAFRGYHKVAMPPSWKSLQAAFLNYPDEDVSRLVRELSIVFGDGRSLEDVRHVAENDALDPSVRRSALQALVEARYVNVVPLLRRLVNDAALGPDAARGLAAFNDPATPDFLVQVAREQSGPVQQAAIETLCSRADWTRPLLTAVESRQIDPQLVPAFQVQEMHMSSPDYEIRFRVAHLWPALKLASEDKRDRIRFYKAQLDVQSIQAANLSNGRCRFNQTCATCHVLFGEGTRLGPDLTGSQRSNLNYLLQNIVDPSATILPGYDMAVVSLGDGRVLHGIVKDRGGETVEVQTPSERSVVNRAEIEGIEFPGRSLMPDGLLDVLPATDVRDLIAYLMSPGQVPLPNGNRNGNAAASK
jgi:putative membrane-bound dehydrogenase-like protein